MKYENIINKMTLEEKASLCVGKDYWNSENIERLGIPSIKMSDGPHGLRVQKEKGDNLGVNKSEVAICFPSSATIANSWDKDIAYKVGAFELVDDKSKQRYLSKTISENDLMDGDKIKTKQEIEEFNKTMIDKITFNKSKFKQTQLTKGNKNRSICLKYRHFCEDNDKYSPTEVFELYEQIIARNNNVINSSKNKNSSLIKSLEPFDNYFKPYNIIAEIKNIDLKSVVSTLSKKEIKINDLNSVGELFGLEVIPDLIDYFKFTNVTFNLVKSPLMTKLPKNKTKLNSENNTNDSQNDFQNDSQNFQENNFTEQNSQITPIFNFPKTHAKN